MALDEARWSTLAAEVFIEIKEWRLQHPTATFAEIEAALDERWARVRARMVQDVALASAAAEVRARAPTDRPACPACGGRLAARGRETREVTVAHDQTVALTREYAVCAGCGTGVFPLDEELQLWPGDFSPSLVEGAARLGTWIPFPQVPALLRWFTGTVVAAATARRLTEAAGQAYVAVQAAEVTRLERERPAPPDGPAVLQVSVDGAMVPLRGKGAWAEVKTLAIGTVQPPTINEAGQPEVHVTELSYFSRMTDAETFGRLATVETHRRGVETAGIVCGVADGADWCQAFLDLHRPDAVRILDFPHAGRPGDGYLVQVAQAGFGAGTPAARDWLTAQCHGLKHASPAAVLAAVRAVRDDVAGRAEAVGALAAVETALAYLSKRQAQLAYATFQAQGYPIGSGIVESANKLVVEARLKGAGMHWAREHVDPMVALRTIACSDRWAEAWPQIGQQVRRQHRAAAAQRRATRRTRRAALLDSPGPARASAAVVGPVAAPVTPPRAALALAPRPAPPPPRGPRRPAADHPWRRRFIVSRPRNAAAAA